MGALVQAKTRLKSTAMHRFDLKFSGHGQNITAHSQAECLG